MHSALFLLPLAFRSAAAIYYPVREYSGNTFFDSWSFYDNVDDTTWGNVTFVGEATANSTQLISVNSAGNAIIRVDDTDMVAAATLIHRNSVSTSSFLSFAEWRLMGGAGSDYLAGYVWGGQCYCRGFRAFAVWPSFWLLGQGLWPNAGEVDIIEGINLADANQFSMHTTAGCTQPANVTQTGKTTVNNCLDVSGTNNNGCITVATEPNSLGEGFATAGGGVYAVQMDVNGIYMWFWSRSDIPKSISGSTATSTLEVSDWGTPSAAYPATTCNITEFFQPQQMILDITLCGLWAGVPSIYAQTCPGTCIDNIIGNGSVYANAYFEIPYIRTYSLTQQNAAETTNSTTGGNGSGASDSKSGSPGDSSQSGSTPSPSGTSAADALSVSWRRVALLVGFLVALVHAI
ncbi:GH16 domain-containing protein [Mycena chlorophos]|uniref:GH16 domain-containing protein n=1 Tax=Mycena chlorophos TaxID=658473 RepID=A0A8H6TLM4_MYCCL|nr:GH16 domain-containing protein [Mycena chlorophos]